MTLSFQIFNSESMLGKVPSPGVVIYIVYIIRGLGGVFSWAYKLELLKKRTAITAMIFNFFMMILFFGECVKQSSTKLSGGGCCMIELSGQRMGILVQSGGCDV